MNYTPLIKALGMNPHFWARFTIGSKQVWWDERVRCDGFVHILSHTGRMMQRNT